MKKTLLLAIPILLLLSCKKDDTKEPVPFPVKEKVLLKDVIISGLPTPYYHFKYDADTLVTNMSFAANDVAYILNYTNKQLQSLQNIIPANMDKLKYTYNAGQVTMIAYINKTNITYKRCFVSYNNAGRLEQMEWETKIDNVGFAQALTFDFTYYTDGNLNTINTHQYRIDGVQEELIYSDKFEQYDNKRNVDDFSLLHRSQNDHLILLPGIILQYNNASKITRTGSVNEYVITYAYQYNNNLPVNKSGNMHFTSGPNAGKDFPLNTAYEYYE